MHLFAGGCFFVWLVKLTKNQDLKMKKQLAIKNVRGFTLVEIAIVLVIIGLLIGGVLRGQELLNSARANAVNSQQTAVKTAYFGFVDRYKAQPGDLTAAQALLINSSTAPASASGDGNVLLADSPAFFNNLAQAGFISCSVCSDTSILTAGASGAVATYTPPAALTTTNTMTNTFGQPLVFLFNSGTTAGSTAIAGSNTAGSINFLATTTESAKPVLTTGSGMATNMLAELDRKSDDGNPSGGSFRYTDIVATGSTVAPFVPAAASSTCFNGSAAAGFSWSVNPPSICQGANLL
jgi:prepilin-type N-terminal cleavage/methylation domain-containing protein